MQEKKKRLEEIKSELALLQSEIGPLKEKLTELQSLQTDLIIEKWELEKQIIPVKVVKKGIPIIRRSTRTLEEIERDKLIREIQRLLGKQNAS